MISPFDEPIHYCSGVWCALEYDGGCSSPIHQVDLYKGIYFSSVVACDKVIENWRQSGYLVQ